MRIVYVFVVACLAAGVSAAESPSYDRDVAPILRTYCAGCHNDRDREGELSVERFATLRKGGAESGDPVVAGDAAGSVLIQRIESDKGDHMPPADEPQPTAADLAMLKRWIAAGAAGPKDDISILQSLVVPPLPAYGGAKPVTAVAVVEGGRRLAVARGRSVELLAAPSSGDGFGAASPLAGPPPAGRVNAVHASVDGTSLVLAMGITGLRGVAEIRELATGRLVRSFGDHRDTLHDAELSPDGKTLATAGYDRSVKLWNVADGRLLRSIDVHDGAVFDLAWHPSGKLLASASADETVKLWRLADGLRLDTLNQPQGELFAVAFTPDGRHVIATGRDRRIHVWALRTLDAPGLNPPLHSRFAHESPIVAMAVSADGRHMLTAGEDRSLKCWSLPNVVLEREHPRQPDLVSVIVPRSDGFLVGRMDGSLGSVPVPASAASIAAAPTSAAPAGVASGQPVPVVSGSAVTVMEVEPNDTAAQAAVVAVPAAVKGTIGRPGEVDCFRVRARAGETLVFETDAARSKSRLDSRIEVLDAEGRPVEQVVLQATRDSWFTFRGKDSNQTGDFRIHNWMEMQLNQYLYANGEVVKLWLHPRGADSGFDVYPGEGGRHAYFGTTSVTHALGEPAWIVEPLPAGSSPVPNGLPVFRLSYENDDESTRRLGADSHVLFPVPRDGEYVVRVSDVRGFGDAAKPDDFRYTLSIRPAKPGFTVAVGGKDPKVSPGSGKEVSFTATRFEGFDGPIRIDIGGLPPGFTFHGPIEIETGQRKAVAVITAAADAVAADAEADKAVMVRATATVAGREVVQQLGTLGDIQLGGKPKVTVVITPSTDGSVAQRHPGEPLEFTIRPGQTITAKVKATRHDFKDRIDFGNADSGRNLPHGVYVDNIGLNGLLIVEGQDEREFFISAAPVAQPGRRLFHLLARPDGGQASVPVMLNVLPAK
jgi:WD40 repeat protein